MTGEPRVEPPPAGQEQTIDPNADDLTIPVSAIEHYSYCPRQCALIHVEQTYADNVFTMRGKLAHTRVDSGDPASNRGVRTVRAMPLWSDRLGLQGKADAVEFRPTGPYPIEYKSGRRRGRHVDLQLCAQALCLEEMLNVRVARGAVYSVATRRHHEIVFDADLRARTLDVIAAIRVQLKTGHVPEPVNDARCPRCSLIDVCLPSVVAEPARLRGLDSTLFHLWDIHPPGDSDT
jgi:CRISPR-associated exonuclease Cas4